ncbi:MAG: efflux RND transporter periplasmic adaptor subunit, partial [Longimicrobiales bacterium]
KQIAVAVAEANLADARQTLDELLNGANPDDIRKAELNVQAAQAALDALTLRAPSAGEALVINYQPGDSVSQSEVAVVLADRSQIHVEATIDESDISQVALDDQVVLTFDALPGLTLSGAVAYINPVGETVQGLVKYTVRVDAEATDPRVLLGMTANVNIVTAVQEGALAVPLDAVQLDEQGEFVNRITAMGAVERVNVVSGQVQEDVVVVTGDLKPGDTVQLIEPQPTNNGGPFGGPGG